MQQDVEPLDLLVPFAAVLAHLRPGTVSGVWLAADVRSIAPLHARVGPGARWAALLVSEDLGMLLRCVPAVLVRRDGDLWLAPAETLGALRKLEVTRPSGAAIHSLADATPEELLAAAVCSDTRVITSRVRYLR